MNTNKSAVCSTAQTNTSGPSVSIPASPELLECIQLLQSVNDKLQDWSRKFPEFVKDFLPEGGVCDMDMALDGLIAEISDLMRWQIVENIRIHKKSA